MSEMTEMANTREKNPGYGMNAKKILVLLLLWMALLVFLFPMIIIIINSFKTGAEFSAKGALSIPSNFTLEVLAEAWQRTDFGTKMMNSAVISIAVSGLALVLSLLNGYALGIGRVKGKACFLMFFILAMTMPQEALAYPLYYLFKLLRLYDTQLSVILILAVLHTAFGTYLLSSVFGAFPTELIESAKLDGCSKWYILWRIVLPLNLPAMSVLFVFFFIWTWNEFFIPLIFLITNAKQTVPLGIALYQLQYVSIPTLQSASSFLGILPCVIFFIIFQRTLTRGITAGGLKG